MKRPQPCLAFILSCWILGCNSGPPPQTRTRVSEDYGPTHPDTAVPIASQPTVTPEEADVINQQLHWADTMPLPETESDGSPAVFYVLVEITRTAPEEQLLTMSGIPWDQVPMFPEERAAWGAGPSFVYPGTTRERGTFVFAFMPGANYNVAREAGLMGMPLFPLVILREPPPDARVHDDGSIDLQWLASIGFCWPTGVCP